MADVKTVLRETSVIIGALLYTNKIDFEEKELFDDITYKNILEKILCKDIIHADNVLKLSKFSDSHLVIIKNGLKLAKKIINSLVIKDITYYEWLGHLTQKNNPIDILINNYGFSLKEESYILENMGLYKFLTIFTGKTHNRGINVFESFANKEYDSWFKYTWEKLVKHKEWVLNNKKSVSKIIVQNNIVQLTFIKNNNELKCEVPINISTINQYNKYTNSIIREKVVGKFINQELKSDHEYLRIKKYCAEVAGKNLVEYLKTNLNYKSVARFLQIYDTSYYYAKSTSKNTYLFYVPSISEYMNTIKVKSIVSSVPISQLNILTTIINESTGKEILLRNECRFSHGQFNGTPEAKMYYDAASDLSVLYDTIDE